MAREIGVEFTTATIGLGDDLVDYTIGESIEERRREWLPEDDERLAESDTDAPIHPGRCTQLFESPVISPAGDVMPCRYATHPGNSFGNLERASFDEIWNNESYRYSRSLFVRPLSIQAHSSVKRNLCTSCPNFRQRKP